MRIVCRTSNRVFVGAPMCMCPSIIPEIWNPLDYSGRNPDYEELNIQFTLAIVKAAIAIKIFPEPLKPCGYSHF